MITNYMTGKSTYDLLVIGAGPAGLAAARRAARSGYKTLVMEKLPRPGMLAHPCSGVMAPLPGIVRAEQTQNGLRYPEVDLEIPATFIIGQPNSQRYLSPGEKKFEISFSKYSSYHIVAVDKSRLLMQMAEDARDAGAEIHYQSLVTELIKGKNRIIGLRTRQREYFAQVVISAEGVSRQFAQQAGLYQSITTPARYVFLISEKLQAPQIGPADVGQLNFLGKSQVSFCEPSFAALVIPAPGMAELFLSIFSDNPELMPTQNLSRYLEDFKLNDPRIRPLLKGARVVHRAGSRMVLRGAPPSVVLDGFLCTGDAVGPGGQTGILPSIYLGQQAAQAAVRAVQSGNTSRANLLEYEHQFRQVLSKGLETESNIITGLAAMRNEELDRLCQTLSRLDLAPFFFGEWKAMLLESLRWMTTSLPFILRDWKLLGRMMGGGNKSGQHNADQRAGPCSE